MPPASYRCIPIDTAQRNYTEKEAPFTKHKFPKGSTAVVTSVLLSASVVLQLSVVGLELLAAIAMGHVQQEAVLDMVHAITGMISIDVDVQQVWIKNNSVTNEAINVSKVTGTLVENTKIMGPHTLLNHDTKGQKAMLHMASNNSEAKSIDSITALQATNKVGSSGVNQTNNACPINEYVDQTKENSTKEVAYNGQCVVQVVVEVVGSQSGVAKETNTLGISFLHNCAHVVGTSSWVAKTEVVDLMFAEVGINISS